MSYQARVLQPADLETIQQFEQKLLACRVSDEMEREMLSWHAPWRRESLEHYLPMGWCFGVFTGELKGYFLAQPQLFTRGFTQALWVEHLGGEDNAVSEQLIDIAQRLCREKHFQMLYVQKNDGSLLSFKTAKF